MYSLHSGSRSRARHLATAQSTIEDDDDGNMSQDDVFYSAQNTPHSSPAPEEPRYKSHPHAQRTSHPVLRPSGSLLAVSPAPSTTSFYSLESGGSSGTVNNLRPASAASPSGLTDTLDNSMNILNPSPALPPPYDASVPSPAPSYASRQDYSLSAVPQGAPPAIIPSMLSPLPHPFRNSLGLTVESLQSSPSRRGSSARDINMQDDSTPRVRSVCIPRPHRSVQHHSQSSSSSSNNDGRRGRPRDDDVGILLYVNRI